MKQRVKQAQAAAKLLDPSTTHIDYIAARGHPRFDVQAIVVMVGFVVLFVVALAMGYIILPGFLAAYFVYYSIVPPRGVVIADQGVAVLHRSFWNSKPNRVIALLTHEQMAQVQAIAKGSKAEMAFGPERLTFSKGEWVRFTAAVQQASRSWTGDQHLSGPGGPAAAPTANPGAPAGGAPAADSQYTGLPPIPGVDTARDATPPTSGPISEF